MSNENNQNADKENPNNPSRKPDPEIKIPTDKNPRDDKKGEQEGKDEKKK